MSGDLLRVRGLRVSLSGRHIVRGMDLTVRAGECLGLAGESGCGKSVSARALMGLLPARQSQVTATLAEFDGRPLTWPAGGKGQGMAMVFQDPAAALDPVFRVGDQVAAAARRVLGLSQAEARRRAAEALEDAGLDAIDTLVRAWPHELSGGMRQRVMLAMAFAVRPRLLIADEATTALDVTTQAAIMARLKDLQHRHGTAILLISHDLGLIAQAATDCLVMYRGRVVESGACRHLFRQPAHPYTAGLVRALPSLAQGRGELPQPIPGTVPSVDEPVTGCGFADRCARADERCHREDPVLNDHGVACFHPLGPAP